MSRKIKQVTGTVLLTLTLGGCETTGLGGAVLGTILESAENTTGGVFNSSKFKGARKLMNGTTDALCGSTPTAMCRNFSANLVLGLSNEFVERMTQRDVDLMGDARSRSITSGQTTTWENPETGASGSVTATPAPPKAPEATQIKVAKEQVAALPPMDAVGESYMVKSESGVNMRSGPGTQHNVVGNLGGKQRVQAIAKVRNANWYLVGQDDVASGYVFGNLIEPAPILQATAPPAPAPEPLEVEQATVSMAAECYTTSQSIVLADGATEEAEVTSCRTPNGWVQV